MPVEALSSALAATDELCVCDLSWVAVKPENLVSSRLAVTRAGRGLLTAVDASAGATV
jgi:hypothetical protein